MFFKAKGDAGRHRNSYSVAICIVSPANVAALRRIPLAVRRRRSTQTPGEDARYAETNRRTVVRQGIGLAIATRTFKRGEGGPAPIQIQAQFLREARDCEPTGPLSGFAITLDDEALRLGSRHERGRWLQKDVERAMAAAQKAGVDCYRVEIAPDGTISIVVGAPSERPAVPDAA